jgi:putative RNA 2'-phosphotransferase
MIMNLTKVSQFISLVLRHKPETIGITIDKYGYANTNDLIKGVKTKYPEFNKDILIEIVETDEKQRYSFKDNGKLIRANQGHSFPVDLGLEAQQPPLLLFHGTSTKYLDSIMEKGIISKSRQYVHLSKDVDTAYTVGLRHGAGTVILVVSAEQMWKDGYKFFLSENGVWLVDEVPTKYFTLWHVNSDFDLKHLKVIAGEYDEFFVNHVSE